MGGSGRALIIKISKTGRLKLLIQAIMFYVYILVSVEKNTKYIGFTSDLKARLQRHNEGQVLSTKANRPWELLYYEAYRNSTLARKAELFYKTGQGRRQINRKLGLLKEEIDDNTIESENNL